MNGHWIALSAALLSIADVPHNEDTSSLSGFVIKFATLIGFMLLMSFAATKVEMSLKEAARKAIAEKAKGDEKTKPSPNPPTKTHQKGEITKTRFLWAAVVSIGLIAFLFKYGPWKRPPGASIFDFGSSSALEVIASILFSLLILVVIACTLVGSWFFVEWIISGRPSFKEWKSDQATGCIAGLILVLGFLACAQMWNIWLDYCFTQEYGKIIGEHRNDPDSNEQGHLTGRIIVCSQDGGRRVADGLEVYVPKEMQSHGASDVTDILYVSEQHEIHGHYYFEDQSGVSSSYDAYRVTLSVRAVDIKAGRVVATFSVTGDSPDHMDTGTAKYALEDARKAAVSELEERIKQGSGSR